MSELLYSSKGIVIPGSNLSGEHVYLAENVCLETYADIVFIACFIVNTYKEE